MSVRIARLTELPLEDCRRLISGYRSDQRYRVEKTESAEETRITLTLEDLPEPFIKQFEAEEELKTLYPDFVAQGLSFGAWADGQLVGIALCEREAWNNTLRLWELHVQNGLRGQGIGSRLIAAVQRLAAEQKFRAVTAEAQNTNVPAIRFYRKHGFVLEGVDLSLYSNEDMQRGEVAVYMKWGVPVA
jgi:ribosomal protein S18 acetylase RimI-like enzyme